MDWFYSKLSIRFRFNEQYDFLKQQCNKLPKLKYPRYDSAAVTIQEKYIFIAGGCDRFCSIMYAEIYDRKINKWNLCPSMLKPVQKSLW